MIIIYKLKEEYISNLHKHLSLAFLGIGIVSFAYMYLLRIGIVSDNIWGKAVRINLIFSTYESVCLVFAIKNESKNFNFNRIFIFVILISMLTAYFASSSPIKLLKVLEVVDGNYVTTSIRAVSILLKVYLLMLIRKMSGKLSEDMTFNFNVYLVSRICMQITGVVFIESYLKFIMILNCVLLAIGNYSVLKIMVVEIVRNPYTNLYLNLLEKSEKLKKTVNQLTEANYEKKILSMDIEKNRREEELKNELLTNISHEFKTPVNVIYSAIQTQEFLQNSSDTYVHENYNDIIKQNCNRLIRLINNFIDITRLEKGSINAQFKHTNIVNLTESIVTSVIPYAESKNLSVIFDTTDEELYCLIDEQLYERLLLNILSNSIKYSKDEGEIKVYIADLDKKINIIIKDYGIGMKKDDLNIIFNRFERIDKSLSRKAEGSGLGLNIVKGIVDLMKGTIRIVSEENKGTIVELQFPKDLAAESDESAEPFSGDKHLLFNQKHETEIEMSDIYF